MTEITQQGLLALAKKVQLGNYRPAPFVLVRGEGMRVTDDAGKTYLDLSAGIAVCSVGHSHPRLARAIGAQAGVLMHTSNLFYNDKAILFASALTERTGFGKVFFANSGAEVNEAMLKLARRFHYDRGDKERVELVGTINSFHGRTMGALSVTGQLKYHAGMEPLLGGVKHVAYGDLDAMRAVITDKTAAVILEPIQAEGGIIVATDDYLRGLRALCDERGALLLFDEVQTGYGRTGRFLAREWSGVRPDACSLAKGIAGGFPLGAMLVTDAVSAGLPPGSHASTFGGNPLACAAALEVLSIFDDERIVENVERVGAHLTDRLNALLPRVPAAKSMRGKGLLQGIQLAEGVDPAAAIAALREAGVLLSIAGADVLRISPPLIATEADLDEGLAIIENVLRGLR